jgi:hypothetical protein
MRLAGRMRKATSHQPPPVTKPPRAITQGGLSVARLTRLRTSVSTF